MMIAGCESSEKSSRPTSSESKEVHVLNLLRTPQSTSTDEEGRPEVLVRLHPSFQTGIYNGSLVFVLSAPTPVAWRVQTERIINNTEKRHTFMIQKDSRVIKENRIHIRVRETRRLPNSTRDELLSFVRHKFHAVTSYTEITQANGFLKLVGSESSLPPQCTITENLITSNTVASLREKQDLWGCSVTQNKGINNRDVHILELDAASESADSSVIPNVTVNLYSKLRANRHKHIVLVLKARQQVNWHVHTNRLRGTLDIIVDVRDIEVNREYSNMQRVRVAAEGLNDKQGPQLTTWVHERYGPPLSYSRVILANYIELIVDAEEANVKASTENDVPPNRSLQDTLSRTKKALTQAVRLVCQRDGLEAALRKTVLEPYGIGQGDISLIDSHCGAQVNASHFILDTAFNQCGTRWSPKENLYKNAIVIHQVDLDLMSQLEGSALMGPTDQNSAYGPEDDTLLDDEDFSLGDSITIPIKCPQSVPIPLPSILPNLEYKLDLYSDEDYTQKITNFPHRITEKNKIYVEASVTGEGNLKAMIEDCWVAQALNAPKEDRHPLITSGCEIDKFLWWYNGEEDRGDLVEDDGDADTFADLETAPNFGTGIPNGQRFGFKFFNYFDEMYLTYIMCSVNVCSMDSNYITAELHKCLPQKQYCLKHNIEHNNPRPVAYRQDVNKGPLMIIKVDPGDPNIGSSVNASPTTRPIDPWPQKEKDPEEVKNKCEQIVRVEGLDSGTVVGIAFAAFIIGVLLTAVLWFIHTHTGPIRNINRPRSAETSGESTPSSTAPIAIHHIHS